MTTETHLRNIIKSTYGIEHIKTDFDIVDEKGRKVGYTVQVNQIESAILDADARNGWHVEVNLPLTYFEVCPQATRNGERYGAGQRWLKVATIEEARALAQVKTESSRKSYARKYKAKVEA